MPRRKINCRDEEAIYKGLKSEDMTMQEQAYRCLYKYKPLIWKVGKRVGGDRVNLDDVIQETLLDVFSYAKSGQLYYKSMSALVATIAKRKWIDSSNSRNYNSDKLSNLKVDNGVSENLLSSGAIGDYLDSIGELCKKIIYGRYRDGKALDQIAADENISKDMIKIRSAKCMKDMFDFFNRKK